MWNSTPSWGSMPRASQRGEAPAVSPTAPRDTLAPCARSPSALRPDCWATATARHARCSGQADQLQESTTLGRNRSKGTLGKALREGRSAWGSKGDEEFAEELPRGAPPTHHQGGAQTVALLQDLLGGAVVVGQGVGRVAVLRGREQRGHRVKVKGAGAAAAAGHRCSPGSGGVPAAQGPGAGTLSRQETSTPAPQNT